MTDICPEDIEAKLPDGFFGLKTCNELGSPVKKGDPFLEINGKNSVADAFHYGATWESVIRGYFAVGRGDLKRPPWMLMILGN